MKITEPGIYEMTAAEYHADPCPETSLSCTGIKRLLDFPFKGCPALFKHLLENPEPTKDVWQFGKAAHTLLLGKGEAVVEVPFDEYRSNEAKAARDEVLAAGGIPLKPKEYAQVTAMVAAAQANKQVRVLFKGGKAENVLIWYDEEYKLWCRAMMDYTHPAQIVTDYKTCQSAHPDAIEKAVAEYGYFVQAPFYLEGVRALKLMDDPGFIFLFQEKKEPYLTLPVQLDRDDMERGKLVIRHAKHTLRKCLDSNQWPSYNGGKIYTAMLPSYAAMKINEAEDTGRLKS